MNEEELNITEVFRFKPTGDSCEKIPMLNLYELPEDFPSLWLIVFETRSANSSWDIVDWRNYYGMFSSALVLISVGGKAEVRWS